MRLGCKCGGSRCADAPNIRFCRPSGLLGVLTSMPPHPGQSTPTRSSCSVSRIQAGLSCRSRVCLARESDDLRGGEWALYVCLALSCQRTRPLITIRVCFHNVMLANPGCRRHEGGGHGLHQQVPHTRARQHQCTTVQRANMLSWFRSRINMDAVVIVRFCSATADCSDFLSALMSCVQFCNSHR